MCLVHELVGALVAAREPSRCVTDRAFLRILVRPALRDADDAAAHRSACPLDHESRLAPADGVRRATPLKSDIPASANQQGYLQTVTKLNMESVPTAPTVGHVRGTSAEPRVT